MTVWSLAQRPASRQRKRRILASALCAASFLTGQALFGAEPGGSGQPAPSLLSEYHKAKGQISAVPATHSSAAPHEAPKHSSAPAARAKPASALQALPVSATSTKTLRPASLEPVSQLPLEPVAPDVLPAANPPVAASLLPAKPARSAASADTEQPAAAKADQLPPIVPAWAVPRPARKLPQRPAASQSPAAAVQPAARPIAFDKLPIDLGGGVSRIPAAAPSALQTQSLSEMKPLDARLENSLRPAPEPAAMQTVSKPLPQILTAPSTADSPQFPVTNTPRIAPPVNSPSVPAPPAEREHARTPAPLEIYNPNVKPLAKQPAPSPPPVPSLPPAAAPLAEKPAEQSPAEQPAAPAPKAAVAQANELAPVVRAPGKSHIQALLNVVPSEPREPTEPRAEKSAVAKADFETRLADQPPRPELLPPQEEGLGVLPPGSPFEAIEQSGTVKLRVRRSILLRTKVDVYRTAIVDESVCDIVQFTPREVSIIGRSVGQTHVTFWLDEAGSAPLTYLVDVQPDPQQIKADENKYELLQNVINEMFPDSKVYLVLVADKLLVKGQAKDSEEAAQIMNIVRAQASGITNGNFPGLSIAQGAATPVLSQAATGGSRPPTYQVINMLRVPGVQQVALRVKIAELNRSAARGFGIDANAAINFSDSAKSTQLFLASMLNASSTPGAGGTGGTSVVTSFGGQEVNIGLRYLQERGVIRLLSEPTLVTLSGRPATFIAGGEFAVPTIVGSVGLNAVTTDFRAFGAIISFLPTVVDKDRIRLQVAPEFSQINTALTSANNTPGLNVRAATTTVEMREGQTLAIAGLLEDSYKATTVGDLPGLAKIFGRRDTTRSETELIILVTPELVHPMEPEEVPPLPGFDVTEVTATQFFLHGEIEGNPTQDYRSTVWPRLRRRYGMGGPAMTSGPFGHGQ